MDSPKPTILTERQIVDIMLDREQAKRLEHIIASNYEKLQKFDKSPVTKSDLGPKLSLNQAREELSEIKNEVDEFLEVKSIRTPKIQKKSFISMLGKNEELKLRYGYAGTMLLCGGALAYQGLISDALNGKLDQALIKGFLSIAALGIGAQKSKDAYARHKIFYKNSAGYADAVQTIYAPKLRKIPLISHMTHEYTHHVQMSKGIMLREEGQQVFTEGHARGVARQLDSKRASLENNPAFLYYSIHPHWLAELKIIYSWITLKLKIPAIQKFLESATTWDGNEIELQNQLGKPGVHAIGNAFFSSQELIQGSGIYKDVINGKFKVK